jgi:hypothetical protein
VSSGVVRGDLRSDTVVCMGAMRNACNMLLEYLQRDVGGPRARSEVVD